MPTIHKMFRNSGVGSNNKFVEWLFLFGILLLYNISTDANLTVKVWLDSRDCDGNWYIREEIVIRVFQNFSDLGLNGTGVYRGCQPSQIPECYNKNDSKAMETFLYFGNASSSLVGRMNEMLKVPVEVNGIPNNISQNFICGIVTVDLTNPSDCTSSHCSTTSSLNVGSTSGASEIWIPFNFSTAVRTTKTVSTEDGSTNKPKYDAKQSGEGLSPAAIAGASVGAVAGFGLLAALAGLLHRKLSNAAKVGNDSFSDVQPIVPGVGFDEAPNSVAPAGTN